MTRKTVDIDYLLEIGNRALAADLSERNTLESLTPEQMYRRGVMSILESVLHNADRYRGFSYQPSELTNDYALRDEYDETRVMYH